MRISTILSIAAALLTAAVVAVPLTHLVTARPPHLEPVARTSTGAAPVSDGRAAEAPTVAPTIRVPERSWLTGTAMSSAIGGFGYHWYEDGSIDPDPAWVAASIVTRSVPVLGEVTCNRLVLPQLRAAMRELEREGLAALIDPSQYAGCYVPRFIDRDPSGSLSLHSFGIALDLNTTTNQDHTVGDMDPRVVEVMNRWGFTWGGLWQDPDPMHFEAYALLRR